MDVRLFGARQDRFVNGVTAKFWELAQDASLSTILRWLEVVGVFLNQKSFSRTSTQNFSQLLCFIPCQGVFVFGLQNVR
ncbi:MAG TPA: hypothetical protein PKK96_00805 [Anaerolineales bacterium]|nr:hypothetical protein [Anaerolineales bacterium]HNQ94091.1 hypothetical protein [Anaerolineales bacterium]HNS59513.1 hypothetical protein [Anaerolineales bacterium]